jgi:hypothetical protein
MLVLPSRGTSVVVGIRPIGGNSMKHRVAEWLYRLLVWLATKGHYEVDTGADWHQRWGPFSEYGSERYQYCGASVSLWDIELYVEDSAVRWVMVLDMWPWLEKRYSMDCSVKGEVYA